MKVVRAASGSSDSIRVASFQLPPEIVDRAAASVCWISLISAVSSLVSFSLQNVLQPEMRQLLANPVQRLIILGLVLCSIGFIALMRAGWATKQTLLDLGSGYRVLVAFAIASFETGLPVEIEHPVRGVSLVAVWIVFTAFMLPNAPWKVGLSSLGCVVAWPASYWINSMARGFPPPPVNRFLVWLFPLALTAIWAYVINLNIIRMQVSTHKAEDMGSYKLDYMIGKGGMGEVWRARHRMLARDAAIKLIRPEMLAGLTGKQESVIRKRFELEAQATASLRSPHTVALFDFGMTKDHSFYYVMELLDGIDLQTMVERFGPLPPGRVAHILLQAAESLEEAHRHGLVHRDIKPKNMLLCRLGLQYDFTKVLDFGLVKSIAPSGDSLMTMEGVATGTPAYLSPEVAMAEPKIDGRSDLYSLGCVAYFLLTGQLVFTEQSPMALALAHVQKQPAPPSERTELPIPAGLESLILRMIEKKPENRPRSAEEIALELRSLRDVPRWTHSDAMEWWRTNLPETATAERTEPEAVLVAHHASQATL